MSRLGEDIQALVAGELSPEAAERVLAQIASDPAAQAELDECMQMRALAHDAGPSNMLAARRNRKWIAVAVAAPLAAAAAIAIYIGTRPKPPDDLDERFVAALEPHRTMQPRLAWPTADHYRPYDPPRAATANAEHVPLELLARAEQTGDPRAVIAAQLLAGNPTAAAAALDRAPATADALSDRAALALVAGDAERALVAATSALELQPSHPQASWNRALALRALGLDRSAAAAFDAIAKRGEPGWADEARAQAAALHAERARRDDAWKNVQAAGIAMVHGGPIPLDQVAAFPGAMRLYFYDAVRAAPDAERVKALLPLADALDQASGGHVLHSYAERIATAPFDVRGKLAERYLAVFDRKANDDAIHTLIGDARAAHQDDILLGALIVGGASYRGAIDPKDADEYARVARATGDPWFDLLASQELAFVAEVRGELSAAESILRDATAKCDKGTLAYRCMHLWRVIVEVYESLHRPAAAADALAHAKVVARSVGSIAIEDNLLVYASAQANQRDETTAGWYALAAAFVDELDRSTLTCEYAQGARDSAALALANRNEIARARQLEAGAPPCDKELRPLHAFALAHVVDLPDIAALRATIAKGRTAPVNVAQGEMFDHVDGRLAIRQNREEGRAILRKLTTAKDPQARSYSFAVLIEDAGAHQDWPGVLGLLAEERGLPVPVSCVLGAAQDIDAVFAVRRVDGSYTGATVRRAPGERLGEATVPSELRDALAGCTRVDVLARQPYYGSAKLLPATQPWRYRTAAKPVEPSHGATLVIGNVAPPAALHLAPLNAITPPEDATFLAGADATPSRVLAAMRDAGYIEIHSHGISDVGDDAALLVMSPDADGSYALTSSQIAATKLRGHPVVVLAACEAAASGHAFHTAYGLADAFIGAGARAVISSPKPIADAAAPRFFAGVHKRIANGEEPAAALAAERATADSAQRAWIDPLVVFE